jgi:hypothetical protein
MSKRNHNDDGDLIAVLGHHREVHCTVRFSNRDSNGKSKRNHSILKDPPEVFEAAANDDDQKLPARREMPCASLPVDEDDDDQKLPARQEVPWEVKEEEEEEEVIPVNHPVNHPNDEETSLMFKAFTNKSSTSNVVLPNPAHADNGCAVAMNS